MTKLVWDKLGQRLYEAGLDQGVLYRDNKPGIAWNGLVGVDEDVSDDTTNPVYIDGIKFLDIPGISDYAATLRAITYPDEFLEFEGFMSLGQGLYVDDQPVKTFGLSYRTLVGNDQEYTEHGYQIHIVYNLTAVPDVKSHQTLGESVDPTEFSWTIFGVPEGVPGYRPTAHAIIDSRYLTPAVLAEFENILYGNQEYDARLPSLAELSALVVMLDVVTIIDHGDGTWSAVGPDDRIDMVTEDMFELIDVSATYLDEDTYRITTG